MVSALFDYGRNRVPIENWNQTNFQGFKDLIAQTQKVDEALGEPDCEDPGKAEWMKEVEARLEKIEAAQFRQGAS